MVESARCVMKEFYPNITIAYGKLDILPLFFFLELRGGGKFYLWGS